MKRMLSGIKPTGQLHLGNYIGALRNFVKYQDDYEMYAFIANLHCITIYQDPQTLKKNLRDCAALYLACGLDPNKAVIFQQSDVRAVAQLGWIMECNSYLGELNRQTQYKDKVAKGETGLTVGLYAYPTLMASDILIYSSDYVPVGEDQKQHVELARDIALRFNHRYGETFVVPEPLIAEVGARIMDLQDPTRKMSKSDNSDKGCIYLLDDPKRARKKVMSAVTDNVGIVQFDRENQPGVANLLQILSSLTNEPIDSIVRRMEGKGYGDFKKEVADAVEAELTRIQTEYHRILDEGILENVLREGAEKANRTAEKMLHKVQKKIGVEIF